jgi:hypothetical protein
VFHQKAAFAAFFICGDNAVSVWGVSKNSEFAQMQGAGKFLRRRICVYMQAINFSRNAA